MPKPDTYDIKTVKLVTLPDGGTEAQMEFVARLTAYSNAVNKKFINVDNTVRDVLVKIVPDSKSLKDSQSNFERAQSHQKTVSGWTSSTQKHAALNKANARLSKAQDRVTKDQQEVDAWRNALSERFKAIITDIVEMERRWEYNMFSACSTAAKSHDENVKSVSENSDLKSEPEAEEVYGKDYFEGLRLWLRGNGFIVSPSYLPPAAVFPADEWIEVKNRTKDNDDFEDLAEQADKLMSKYKILGSPFSGINYRSKEYKKNDKVGCVCVSWTKIDAMTNKKTFLVPVLGFSGQAPGAPKVGSYTLEAMLGACALPPFIGADGTKPFDSKVDPHKTGSNTKTSSDYTTYYDDIVVRANNLAVNYRVRKMLNLRLPSRQAMLSYAGLNFNQTVKLENKKGEDFSPLSAPSPAIARWHSLNCAEPAALAWIACFFADGQDVVLCCPYEAGDDPGIRGLKPKETCPWCATVEIAYRSLSRVSNHETWSFEYLNSMTTGKWGREITISESFDLKKDKEMREKLPRNKGELSMAYPAKVNDNVAILREIFKEIGLLTPETIRVLEKPLWRK